MASGQTDLSKFAFLTEALMDELIQELEDRPSVDLGTYMEMMGEVIAWIGHGDTERLPEQVRQFTPQDRTPELEAAQ
jgi:hypothetical protein